MRKSLAFALAAFCWLTLVAADPAAAQDSMPSDDTHAEQPHAGHPQGDHHDAMQHDFSDVERWIEVFDDPERDAWQQPEAVVALLGLEPGVIVADLGAGTGYFTVRLARAVGEEGRVLALDIEPNLVAYIEHRAAEAHLENVEARHIAPDDPGLEPASVDRILCVNTWHHIGDREAYAAQLREALRPGGAVYIVDFTLESAQGPPVEHRLSPEAVAAELTAGGLTAEVLAESLPEQYVVVGRRP